MADSFSTGLLLLIGLMAILYASVGHGGASGYLAAMALFGLSPDIMRPTALVMNIGVSAWVLFRMLRLHPIDWRLLILIVSGSIPAAYLGGLYTLHTPQYKMIVGLLLIIAAVHMLVHPGYEERTVPFRTVPAILTGSVIGLISGLTGVGGGIYLSPILLLLRWTTMRGSILIASASILLNSLAGLAGVLTHSPNLPDDMDLALTASLAGAFIGSELAARKLAPLHIRRLLGIVLIIAGGKFIVSA